MTYVQKPNTGSLFKNQQKTTDQHPDYTGKAVVNGQEFYLSAWINKSKTGVTYMSLAFTVPVQKPSNQPADTSLNDDIPF